MTKSKWGLMAWLWVIAIPLAFGSGISSISNYNPSAVAITGGTITGITGASSFDGGNVAIQSPAHVVAAYGGLNASGSAASYQLHNALLFSATAPTIASGFCTSPSIINANGTAAFSISVGTACATSSGQITLPAATNRWACSMPTPLTAANTIIQVTGINTTTVQVNQYLVSTAAGVNFSSGASYDVTCIPH